MWALDKIVTPQQAGIDNRPERGEEVRDDRVNSEEDPCCKFVTLSLVDIGWATTHRVTGGRNSFALKRLLSWSA